MGRLGILEDKKVVKVEDNKENVIRIYLDSGDVVLICLYHDFMNFDFYTVEIGRDKICTSVI